MAIILDTYNVVHAGGAMGGAVAELNVRRLCQWIRVGAGRGKVTLVLDGRPKPEEPSENEFPEIRLVYSGAGVSADAVIGQLVERSTARRGMTVVSNDRAVAGHARRRGARVQSCEAFLATLVNARGRRSGRAGLSSQKLHGTTDAGQTEHWLREFGFAGPVRGGKKKGKAEEMDDLDMKRLMGF